MLVWSFITGVLVAVKDDGFSTGVLRLRLWNVCFLWCWLGGCTARMNSNLLIDELAVIRERNAVCGHFLLEVYVHIVSTVQLRDDSIVFRYYCKVPGHCLDWFLFIAAALHAIVVIGHCALFSSLYLFCTVRCCEWLSNTCSSGWSVRYCSLYCVNPAMESLRQYIPCMFIHRFTPR